MKLLFVNLLMHLVDYNLLRKDDVMMAKIYFNRLLVGSITYDAIPEKYQGQVKQYGIEYVEEGRLSVEEYEMLFKEEYTEA